MIKKMMILLPMMVAAVELPLTMPMDGTVSLQLRDENNQVVQNIVSTNWFNKGRASVEWDFTDIDGNIITQPGKYTWHGIAIPKLTLHYLYTYYPLGLDANHRAWKTQDKIGGWLADHDPPRGVVRDGETMWLNAWAEHGDSVIRTDINANKQWGETRFWVAVPQEICVDDGYCYGYSQGGWNGTDEEIIRIDPNCGYRASKVFLMKNPPRPKDQQHGHFFDFTVTGFQVLGNKAFVSLGSENRIAVYDISQGLAAPWRNFSWATVHTQFDDIKPVLIKEIKLPRPGRLRKTPRGLVTSSGSDIVLINTNNFAITKLFNTGLENILGLGVADDGMVFVGVGEPLHQVFGFSPEGKRVTTLGKPGKRKIGKWDEDDLEEPAGVEVDAQGRIWVTEHTHWEKRVSIWTRDGKCVHSVLGPTQYGGDGCIDPADSTRLFYRGLELKRDEATGAIKPVNLIYRPDAPELPTLALSDYPSYCFRSGGQLYFTSYQHPHGHSQCVLWRYEGDRVRAVAAVGAVKPFADAFNNFGCITNAVPSLQVEPGRLFAWSDMNGNGQIDADEIDSRIVTFDGKPIAGCAASWNWRMNERFELAAFSDVYKEGHLIYFKPCGMTKFGTPIYKVPEHAAPGMKEVMGVMTDSRGNVFALGHYIASLKSDGRVRWRYRNEWPGLHAGHRTTARGDEPGRLIAPTRVWGTARTEGAAGEVVAFNSNLGCSYLMTAADGLFIARTFCDQRIAPHLWNYNELPDDETMATTSLWDEHFGGTFQRIGDRYFYIVGKGHCAVVELIGLNDIKLLTGGSVTVTPKQITTAEKRMLAEAAARLQPKFANIATPTNIFDGISLRYDATNLYVSSHSYDWAAPFANFGNNPFELFKTGDTLEVMLRTHAPTNAPGIRVGDKRLLISMFKDKPIAVLYDYKTTATAKPRRQAFASPWRTVYVDDVHIIDSARIDVKRSNARVDIECAIPLSEIGLNPAKLRTTRADVGRVHSDATGSSAAKREYWSNKNTAIMSDLPTEVMIQPDLWGTISF